MKNKYTGKIFECTRCGYQWAQRPDVIRESDGLKIKSIELDNPKNCSHCKSPSYSIPRS